MTTAEIRDAVLRALGQIAPEVAPAEIRADVRLRDQVELDSMDFLNFVIELHESLGVEIPESDYARIETLDGTVAYLAARLPTS